MKTYVLPCSSSDPDFNGGCDVAIVEIAEALATIIRLRRAWIRKLQDSDVQAVHFRSEPCISFAAFDTLIYSTDERLEEREAIENGSGYLVTVDRPAPVLGMERAVDGLQMVITKQGAVYWTCNPTHTAYVVTTVHLPLE